MSVFVPVVGGPFVFSDGAGTYYVVATYECTAVVVVVVVVVVAVVVAVVFSH